MSCKTESESDPVRWETHLQDLIEKEPDETEHTRLAHQAFDWNNCAVGQCLQDIGVHLPLTVCQRDHHLESLGNKFTTHIRHREWAQAKEIYDKIEKRVILKQNKIKELLSFKY